MKKIFTYKLLATILILYISGCSIFSKSNEQPVFTSDTHNLKPMVIPKDLDSSQMKDYYPMPKVEKPFKNGNTVSIVPPGANLKK
jgi:uncharacterized lipoprotein